MAQNLNQHTFAESHGSQIDHLASKIHYSDKSGMDDFIMDTFAVGITGNGQIAVACNKKTRDIISNEKSQKYFNYNEFDVGNKQDIRDVIRNNFPEAKYCEIIMVGSKKMPKTPHENAKCHAEMQLIIYSKKAGKSIVVEVSNHECSPCNNALEDHDIASSSVPCKKKKKITKNWDHPDDIKIKREMIAKKPKVKIHHNLGDNLKSPKSMIKSAYTPQVRKPPKMPTSVKSAAKSTLKQMKPGCGAGLGQTIEALIENHDKVGYAEANTLVVAAGTYRGKVSTGAYAKAVTAEASARYSVFHAAVRGPGLSAGVHAGISGVSARATVEVVRAEASAAAVNVGVGLSFGTGASIGIDGVNASVAGFGLSIGPKMGIKNAAY